MVEPEHIGRKSTGQNPWWLSEVRRLEADLLRFVAHRLGTAAAEDVVARVCAEFFESFSESKKESPNKYPEEWFASKELTGKKAHAFRALLWKATRRRMYDQLRQEYVRRECPIEDAPDVASQDTPPTDVLFDTKRFLVFLDRWIGQLSPSDRELLTLAGIGPGQDNKMSPRSLTDGERVRLVRLREKLAYLVGRDLGLLNRESDQG